MSVSLKVYKLDDRNFAPDEGQKALPVYADKFNDFVDRVETDLNRVYTTTGAEVSGLTITDYGNEIIHRTVLDGTFLSAADVLKDGALGAATAAMGKKIFDFPEGGIHVEAAVLDLTLVASLATASVEVGLGTVVATGATSALGASSTYEDVIDGNTGGVTCSTTGTAYQRVAAAESDAAAFDGCGTAKDLYLNAAAAWKGTGTFVVSGTVSLVWSYLGDY